MMSALTFVSKYRLEVVELGLARNIEPPHLAADAGYLHARRARVWSSAA